jgi:serine/threonine protein kinase
MAESPHRRHAFATFRPDNYPSRVVFSGAVDHIKRRVASVEDYRHAKFLAPQSEAAGEEFSLSLDVPGGGPGGAWRLGRGSRSHRSPANRDGDYGVDILLVQPAVPSGSVTTGPEVKLEASARRLFATVHALVFLHPESGAWVLQSTSKKHKIVYLAGAGHTDLELEHGQRTVLAQTTNRLRFGTYTYVLAFDRVGPQDPAWAAFVNARNDYITVFLGREDSPHPRLDPLPVNSHQRIRHVITHRTIAAGRSGTVKCGVDATTGDPVVLKVLTMTEDPETRYHVNRLLHIAAKFLQCPPSERQPSRPTPGPPVGVLPTLAIWCEHGHEISAEFSESEDVFKDLCGDEIEQVYLTMPLARYDFTSLPWDRLSYLDRLSVFHDTLAGIEALHTRGIMHRAVTTKNLLVLSLDSLAAAVGGFGNVSLLVPTAVPFFADDLQATTHEVSATIDDFAPWHTLAPEITTCSAEEPYSNAVDIWALAYAWISTLDGHSLSWEPPDEGGDAMRDYLAKRHANVILKAVNGLEAAGTICSDLAGLLRSMLSFEPADRITAAKAMQHRVWAKTVVSNAVDGGATSCKRTRLVSPGSQDVREMSPVLELVAPDS